MASFCKIIVIGNLTRNPELKYTPGGAAICDLGIAFSRKFLKKDGQQTEETCFIDVTVWGKQAETASRYLQKGSSSLIEGYLSQDQWQDKKTGEKRSRHKIVAETIRFLSSMKDSNSNQTQNPNEGYGRYRDGRSYSQNEQQEQHRYTPDMANPRTNVIDPANDEDDPTPF